MKTFFFGCKKRNHDIITLIEPRFYQRDDFESEKESVLHKDKILSLHRQCVSFLYVFRLTNTLSISYSTVETLLSFRNSRPQR